MQENYEQSYLEIGKLLLQARDIYKGHGNWGKWLKENLPFSIRHAQRLIRVAEMFDDATLVSHFELTSSKAYILTRIGKDDVDDFCNTFFPVGDSKKTVRSMTKRELDLVVHEFLKRKRAATNRGGATTDCNEKSSTKRIALNWEALKKALNRTISSIKASDSCTRELLISELEDLYKTSLDQLTSMTE